MVAHDYQAEKINFQSKWAEYYPSIQNDERYTTLAHTLIGSTPAELFYDYIDEFEEQFYQEKKHVMRWMSDNNVVFDERDSIERFQMKIGGSRPSPAYIKHLYQDVGRQPPSTTYLSLPTAGCAKKKSKYAQR